MNIFRKSRREFISTISAVCAMSSTFGLKAQSRADPYAVEELKKLRKDEKVVQLEIPSLADSGNSIPLLIKIKAPNGEKITSFEVVASENPFPMVLRIQLPQSVEKFQLATRIRLAISQDVWVIASLSNEKKIVNSAPCVVTLNACLDAT